MCEAVEAFNLPCSGHGQCLNGTCHCDHGWTGIGDLSIVRGLDCGVNEGYVLYANYFSFCLNIVVVIPYLYYFYTRLSKKFDIKNNKNIFVLLNIFEAIAGGIYDGGIIMNPNKYMMGTSYIVTMAASAAWMFSLLSMVKYIEICFTFIKGIKRILSVEAKNKVEQKIEKINSYLFYLNPCIVLGTWIPSFCMPFVPPEEYYKVGMAFWYAMVTLLLTFAYLISLAVRTILNGIDDKNIASQTEKERMSLYKLRRNLRIALFASNGVFLSTALPVLGFGTFRWLTLKSPYTTVFSAIAVHIFSPPMLCSLTVVSRGDGNDDAGVDRNSITNRKSATTKYQVIPVTRISTLDIYSLPPPYEIRKSPPKPSHVQDQDQDRDNEHDQDLRKYHMDS